MASTLRMKRPYCGHRNRVLLDEFFIEQSSSEPKVKVLIPICEPLEVVKSEKCGKLIIEPKELIVIRGKQLPDRI